MNEELRERIARFVCLSDGHEWDDGLLEPLGMYADEILAEIEAAGYRIVKDAVWQPIVQAADEWCGWRIEAGQHALELRAALNEAFPD